MLLAIGYAVLSIIFKISFANSSLLETLRVTASLYWMFVLPGYALALCSRQDFANRLIIGTIVQVGIIGHLSYFTGLAGWHISTHGLILPLVSILIGIVLWKRSEKPV
jgi:hypothetical protein